MTKIVASLKCDSLTGDYPIGHLTNLLYDAINYLELKEEADDNSG
jgi:hypothetical protein